MWNRTTRLLLSLLRLAATAAGLAALRGRLALARLALRLTALACRQQRNKHEKSTIARNPIKKIPETHASSSHPIKHW